MKMSMINIEYNFSISHKKIQIFILEKGISLCFGEYIPYHLYPKSRVQDLTYKVLQKPSDFRTLLCITLSDNTVPVILGGSLVEYILLFVLQVTNAQFVCK